MRFLNERKCPCSARVSSLFYIKKIRFPSSSVYCHVCSSTARSHVCVRVYIPYTHTRKKKEKRERENIAPTALLSDAMKTWLEKGLFCPRPYCRFIRSRLDDVFERGQIGAPPTTRALLDRMRSATSSGKDARATSPTGKIRVRCRIGVYICTSAWFPPPRL